MIANNRLWLCTQMMGCRDIRTTYHRMTKARIAVFIIILDQDMIIHLQTYSLNFINMNTDYHAYSLGPISLGYRTPLKGQLVQNKADNGRLIDHWIFQFLHNLVGISLQISTKNSDSENRSSSQTYCFLTDVCFTITTNMWYSFE